MSPHSRGPSSPVARSPASASVVPEGQDVEEAGLRVTSPREGGVSTMSAHSLVVEISVGLLCAVGPPSAVAPPISDPIVGT